MQSILQLEKIAKSHKERQQSTILKILSDFVPNLYRQNFPLQEDNIFLTGLVLDLIGNRDAEASHERKPNQSKRTLWLGVRGGKEAASVLSASSCPVPSPSQTNVHFLRRYLVVGISRQLHSYLPHTHTSHSSMCRDHEHQRPGAWDICQTTFFRVSFWVNGRRRKNGGQLQESHEVQL